MGNQQNNQQNNINCVKSLVNEIYSKSGNLDKADQWIANDVLLNDPATPQYKKGLKAFKELEGTYERAFPNKKTKIDEIFAADDKVVLRWTTVGKHTGSLRQLPASNKDFKVCGISIFKCIDGKVTEICQTWDTLGLYEQLGEVRHAHATH